MYKPPTVNDCKRYTEEVPLEAPIYFIVGHSNDYGISLHDALHSQVGNLENREQAVFKGRGPSDTIRIEVSQFFLLSSTTISNPFFSGQAIDRVADRSQPSITLVLLVP